MTTFFRSTWWGDPKNTKKFEFSRWLFELPAKEHSQFSPSGSIFLHCLGLPSKSHRENSISSIFLESLHQVDLKNVVKCKKHFFGYFNALNTHGEVSFQLMFNINEKQKITLSWDFFSQDKTCLSRHLCLVSKYLDYLFNVVRWFCHESIMTKGTVHKWRHHF